MKVEFRGCPNQSSTSVGVVEPWSFVPGVPVEASESKGAFGQWAAHPSTQHLFYSLGEGNNPGVRVNWKTNKLRYLHGFIADYDAKVSDEMLSSINERMSAEFPPAFQSRTRFSGGARLVWLFESPIALDSEDLAKKFTQVALKELLVEKILPGVDRPAWERLTEIYEVGKNWERVSDKTIPTNTLSYWLYRAAKLVDWRVKGAVNIPIESVAEEVEKRFPGRWDGEFEVGKRGVVFWDEGQSTNPTSTIVTEDGMVSFSTDKTFYSWEDILGTKFVKGFQTDKIGSAVSNVWFDGKYYWRKSEAGQWNFYSKEDFSMWLKVQHFIDGTREKGDVSTEIEKTLVYIQNNRQVSGALPKVYDKTELLYVNSKRFLNVAVVEPMVPAETKQEWGENFPWLSYFFDNFFDPALVECADEGCPPAHPKAIFLGWLQRFYGSAHRGWLKKGQSVFIAGKHGRGKTLLGTRIVEKMMGGGSDAGDFMNNDTSFNKELLEVGLWNIDDNRTPQTVAAHGLFSEMVKRVAANPFFNYHPKFHDSLRVEWNGRLIVTLNDGDSSISLLPSLEESIENKLIILKAADTQIEFADEKELFEIIDRELPYFCRWLLDWEAPKELFGEKRYGIRSYIHGGLRIKSLHSGGVGDLLELVDIWIRRSNPKGTGKDAVNRWVGTASDWMAEVMEDPNLRPLISKYSPKLLGRKFTDASRIKGSRIRVEDATHKGGGNSYSIDLTEEEYGENREEVKKPKKLVRYEPIPA